MESGAHALGCAVIAAGPDSAVHARDVMIALKPTAYVGTIGFPAADDRRGGTRQ